jgi:adenylate cyclase
MEIERKFLIHTLPPGLERYPVTPIRQWYISREPVIRIRDAGGEYFLTVKSKGDLSRMEHELPLTEPEFQNLLPLATTHPIEKKRYRIPLSASLTAELDVFSGHHQELVLVEVEFASEAEANAFSPPDWFGEDVTKDPQYKNNNLAIPLL